MIAKGATSAACAVNGSQLQVGASADDDGSCPFGPNDQSGVADLGLGPLGAFGGPTRTIRPLPTSPLVGAGGLCGGTDQRGRPRGGAPCDVGAVELSGLPDGMVRQGSTGPFAPSDAVTVRPQVGQAATITLRLANRGDVVDHLRVQAPGSSRFFTVTYARNRSDVTADVVAGDYATPELTPGAFDSLVLRVTPRPGAAARTARTLPVVVTSTTSPSATDTLTVDVRVAV